MKTSIWLATALGTALALGAQTVEKDQARTQDRVQTKDQTQNQDRVQTKEQAQSQSQLRKRDGSCGQTPGAGRMGMARTRSGKSR